MKTAKELTMFSHVEFGEVRVVMKGKEPWFIAKDVCKVLDIKNHIDALRKLEDDEKDGVGITDTIGRRQTAKVINESGLYHLVFTSRKAEAVAFRKWVTSEVLPSIRLTGKYAYPEWVRDEAEGREVQRMVDQFLESSKEWKERNKL